MQTDELPACILSLLLSIIGSQVV